MLLKGMSPYSFLCAVQGVLTALLLIGLLTVKCNNLKPCYSQPKDLHDTIKGQFVLREERQALYWNLSCPMEVSKQACSHFGPDHQEHAEYAANLKFEPTECTLHPLPQMLEALSNLNVSIVFVANSLGRGVMNGFSCNAHALGMIERFDLEWQECKENNNYPCHGSVNCIECGEHSGYKSTGAKVHFKGGTEILLVETYQAENILGKSNMTIDLLFVQKFHIEGRGVAAFYHHRKNSSLPLPALIAWNGYNSHFPTGGHLLGGGKYSEEALKKLKEEVGGVVPCVDKVGPVSTSWDKRSPPYDEWTPDAFFNIEDINNHGRAKVGTVVGKLGDCQHFCSPGPADELSKYWVQMVLYLLSAPGYEQLK